MNSFPGREGKEAGIVKNTIGKNHVQEDNESKNQESNRPWKLGQLKTSHPSWSQGVTEGKPGMLRTLASAFTLFFQVRNKLPTDTHVQQRSVL